MVLYDDPRHTEAVAKFEALVPLVNQNIVLAYDTKQLRDVAFRQLRSKLDGVTMKTSRNCIELCNGTRIFIEHKNDARMTVRGRENATIIW